MKRPRESAVFLCVKYQCDFAKTRLKKRGFSRGITTYFCLNIIH